MSTSIDIGSIEVTAINDGTVRLPPMYYPGLDFGAHPELLDADGTYHIPAGCFLVRGEGFTVLVDAGIGPLQIPFPPEIAEAAGLADPPRWIAEGGQLPDGLAAAGVAPTDVSTIMLTHLDADHVGWIAPDGELFFPSAEVVCSAIDLAAAPGPAPGEAEGRRGLEIAATAGLLRTVDAATVELAPGVVARHTPGHTPGHYAVEVTSDGARALLFGDAVHHPLQLNDQGISFMLERDPDDSLRMREEILRSVEGTDVIVNGAHLPGLPFHRIAVEDGSRRMAAA